MQQRFRLRDSRDFDRLRREGSAYPHRLMLLSIGANGLAHNRYGFIISKPIGKAVQRNRVRRLLREAVRHLHPHLKTGYDVVLIARRPLVGQPLSVVQRIVLELFQQAEVVESDVLS